nr:glycoside hydrolase 43 family protein [Prevotella sp.]
MKKYIIVLFLIVSCPVFGSFTFRNPVIWADVPDPDVIRVGDYYYMVSTTMHLMPGAPVMRSTDLVHWTTISYLFDKLVDSPKYNMCGGTVYGHGQWATSLKYHNGRFYALFAPNDSPGGDSYIYTTTDPTKKWTLLSRLPHFHDCSLFFDDDRVFVFSGTGRLQELKSDLSGIKKDGVDMVLFNRDSTETGLLEGSRVVKHAGKYYLIMVSWPSDSPRRQVCYRADSIIGPYEKKVILKSTFGGFSYVGQGTIVDDKDGNWYGMIFQDRGGVGRVLTLMPCTWKDGWPMLGDENGNVPEVVTMPGEEGKGEGIVQSDDFKESNLKYCWQWNHNPVDTAWSLKKHKGYLRLETSDIASSIYDAKNTISQRMEGPCCSGAVSIDISNMNIGDRTGLAVFNGKSGLLVVEKNENGLSLSMQTALVNFDDKDKTILSVDKTEKAKVLLNIKKIYLKIDADFRPNKDIATFFYSVDGKQWCPIGESFKMEYDFRRLFMGTRYAIFNYATKSVGGYVDVDYFHYQRFGE